MDVAVAKLKDRFSKAPVLRKATGHPIRLDVESDDITLYHALAFHYHYLSNEYIAPLLGRPLGTITRRTRRMKRPPNNFLRLSSEQEINCRKYYGGPLFYAIDKAGVLALEERGEHPFKRPAPANLRHQVMIDQIMASIEIGVNKNKHLKLIWWDELLATLPNIPEATRKSKSAYVLLSEDEHGKTQYLRADGLPFVIERNFSGKPEFLFFIGVEADCGTESMPVIREKFKAYKDMLIRKLHTAHFGVKTFAVLVAAPSDARVEKLKAAWFDVTKDAPKQRTAMMFVRHPTFESFEKPRATGHMITEPLSRVGDLKPITLGKPQEA